MEFDFAGVLRGMVEAGASDVHLTPASRRRSGSRAGSCRWTTIGPLDPQDTREIVYWILNDSQRKRFENQQQLDFAYAIPSVARFRVNSFFQRGSICAAFRHDPHRDPDLESLGLPAVLSDFTRKPRGFVLVTGPTGSGKSTTLASMVDVINPRARGAHPDDRGPDRVPPPPQALIVNQREIGADAIDFALALKAALRAGPRRDPGRRDARPGDDLDRADRGRDRPPGLRHPAHPVDRPDRRPDHRRVPAPPAAAGAHAALDRAAGDRHPAAAADRRRLRPGRSPARSWCRPRRSAT